MNDGLDILGCDDPNYVGFDYGALLQTAGGLIQGGVSMYQQHQEEEKAGIKAQGALEAAVKADGEAANALARAAASAQLKSKTADADAKAASAALERMDKAGEGLTDDQAQKRVASAEKALAAAKTKKADGYQKIQVEVWTQIVQKLKGGAIPKPEANSESFWSRRIIGPLSGTAVVVLGAVGAGALGLMFRKRG